jgi:hypothetical protein
MSGSIQKQVRVGETLELIDPPKGTYTISFEPIGDYAQVGMQVKKGKLQATDSIGYTGIVDPTSRYHMQPNQTDSLTVTRLTGLSFVPDADILMTVTTTAADPFDLGDKSSRSWNAGKVDSLTNLSWNEGVVGPGNQAGLTITEKIGGDDVGDWVKFRVTGKATQVKLDTDGAIAEIVKGKSVVMGSSDMYDSSLTASLTRGTYYLHFSSESSMSEAFTSRLSVVV